MGFSNDESLLNDINLDSILQYKQFIDQVRPILLQESGYQETTTSSTLGSKYNQDYNEISNVIGKAERAGLTEAETAAQLGLNRTQFKEVLSRRNETDKSFAALQSLNDRVTNETDPARKAELEAQARAAEKQFQGNLSGVVNYSIEKKGLEKTAQQKSLEERYKKLQESQLTLSEMQAQRQKDALEGKIETSPILAKQIGDEFNAFKESQARAGNTILGDDWLTAVGKGTGAENSLARFQDNAKAAKQREIASIVQGETPLFYEGLGLAGNYGGARAPGSPDYSGVVGLSSGASQPFQFNRQMNMQESMLNSNRAKKSKSGLLTAGLGLAGLGASFALPGPWSPALGQLGMSGGSLLGMGLS